MEIKDAIKWFEEIMPEWYSGAEIYCTEGWFGPGEMVCTEPEGYLYKRAIEALRYEDEYRWHDIQKDPDDLPENDQEEVLVMKRDGVLAVIHAYTLKGTVKLFKAWKRIEPF